jgi:hypothetical protein
MKNRLLPLCTNAPLKIITLCISYSVWIILQNVLVVEQIYAVPVFFYNRADSHISAFPDCVKISLKGSQHALRTLDPDSLVLHINADHLKKGHQWQAASDGNIFVPNSVSVIHYNPALIAIDLKPNCSTDL